MGAVWKFSNSEETVSSLQAIPHSVWLSLIVFEVLCSLCLILPALRKPFAWLAPLGAVGVGLEMLFFSGVLIYSGDHNYGQMVYWLIVGAICLFLVYGRTVLKPLHAKA
ncbi:hypothetical protein [Hahella ganghwensis]|uniref:hypothetical protein n=1 Tax=Hahella ganghwensis TaxID=286420 RepID=UPI0003787ED6|nr:hypothetical protein [Hahella ganghwensis]